MDVVTPLTSTNPYASTPSKENPDVTLTPEQEKQAIRRKELIDLLLKLRNLVLWVESKYPNRHARRQFWREFVRDARLRLYTIDYLLTNIEQQKILPSDLTEGHSK